MAALSDDEILPAFLNEPPSQMSPQEFQKNLYSWFEQKGLLSDLKSYMRVLMIRNLRETTLGKLEKPLQISLSKQAFNLVIAEHLLREGCYYTLSIFSTEVPGVAAQLPFSLFEAHCNRDTDTRRFDDETVVNLLELLGVPKGSSESLRAFALYCRNSGSLLSCLITKKTNIPDINVENSKDNIGEYLAEILKATGIPAEPVQKIIENVQQYTNLMYQRGVQGLKLALDDRDKEIKRLNDVRRENKRLKAELKEAHRKINSQQSQQVDKEQVVVVKEPTCNLKHCDEECRSVLDKNREEIDKMRLKMNSLVNELQKSQSKMEFLDKICGKTRPIVSVKSSSSEESDNVTEEVLKQVRKRLASLERESEELDKKFRALTLR